jgi:hypothetical protein
MSSFTLGFRQNQMIVSRRPRRTANLKRRPLNLELLEGRTVPSTVTTLADSGPGSIRDAIASTPSGGTVDFQPGLSGTITLTSGELAIAQDLTIAGPGASVITVSGNDSSRVFDLTSTTATISLTGLTIAHGAAQNGGGLYMAGGVLSITNCLLEANQVTGVPGRSGSPSFGYQDADPGDPASGGALYVASGSVSIVGSTFSSNQATGGKGGDGTIYLHGIPGAGGEGAGGGIYVDAGALQITDSMFAANQAVGGAGGDVYFQGQVGSAVGGGIYDAGSGLTITYCTFSGNSGAVGGGIYAGGTTNLTVSNSAIGGNKGGGIYAVAPGSMTVSDSTIGGNSGGPGDGIYAGGPLTVSHCTISGNSGGPGGGIWAGSSLTVSDSTITGNSAAFAKGGGIYAAGPLTVSGCTISGNSGDGGGIWTTGTTTVASSSICNNTAGGIIGLATGASMTLTNSTISDNPTNIDGWGFGVAVTGAWTVTVTNCTISGNVMGGLVALDYFSGTITVGNSIIAGNTHLTTTITAWDVFGTVASQGHNLIGDGTGSSSWLGTDQVGTATNPLNPKLGPLQNNGGPTFTLALLPGSPAIDAGDNALAVDPSTGQPLIADQRGFPRIVNGTVDIGAFELQSDPAHDASLRFVSQVYLDLLQRPTDPAGLASWSGMLDSGQADRTQVVRMIEDSPEYHQLVIEQVYGEYLGRAADMNEMFSWGTFLTAGGTIDQMRALVMGSPEYYQLAGGTNDGFMASVYHDVLNRSVDSGGQQYWDPILSNGADRGAVAGAIMRSTEGANDEVEGLYQTLLHRAADAAGLQSFTNDLQQGMPVEQLVAITMSSPEYAARERERGQSAISRVNGPAAFPPSRPFFGRTDTP